jgi:hypothetical protein
VNPDTGSIKLNFPGLEPWEVPKAESCVLDIVSKGTLTLKQIGDAMNITRERIRQLVEMALEQCTAQEEEDVFEPGCEIDRENSRDCTNNA